MNQPPVYREVNRYVLFERIGSGGMSTVWRARRKDEQTDLAIKVIPIEDLNPDFERRLRREPEIHQQLLHESIVPLIDWFREGNEFFLVMEYVNGRPLSAILRDSGALPLTRVREIMRDVLRAVHHLHLHDVVHRDIKPANILLDRNGRAKLTDFGIAKFGWQQGETRTQLGLGTPEYMSPEQVRGAGIDYRTDIWSLGITLFEMLTGRKPFSRGEETPAEFAQVVGKIMNADLPDPRTFNPTIPDGAIAIIRKATAREREERFQSSAEFLGALELVDERTVTPYDDPNATTMIGGGPTPWVDRPAAAVVSPVPTAVPNPIPRRDEAPRRSGRAGLYVVLFLLAAAAIGYFAFLEYEKRQRANEPLNPESAQAITQEIAEDYKRFSFDGDATALASLYAPSGVRYFGKPDADRAAIASDYTKYFSRIVRTERLDVTPSRVKVINDSTLTARFTIAYDRTKNDGTILRGEAIHELTIGRINGEWLITKELEKSIRRQNVAPKKVDTTAVTDTVQPEEPEEPVPTTPSPEAVRAVVEDMVSMIGAGQASEAWARFASDELKGSRAGFPDILTDGGLRLQDLSVNGSNATAIVVKSESFENQQLVINITFGGDGDPKMTAISVSPQ